MYSYMYSYMYSDYTDYIHVYTCIMILHYPFLSTVQLYTYQKAFMTKFSMVSARLDIELLTAQQRMREVSMCVYIRYMRGKF